MLLWILVIPTLLEYTWILTKNLNFEHSSGTLLIIKQQSVFILHKKIIKHKYISTDSRQRDTTVTIKRQFKNYIVTIIVIKHIYIKKM